MPERQTRAVAEFLGALDDEDPDADRKLPKAISPVDPCSDWTAKANKRVQFGYGLNYLIDIKHAIIIDVELNVELSLPIFRLALAVFIPWRPPPKVDAARCRPRSTR